MHLRDRLPARQYSRARFARTSMPTQSARSKLLGRCDSFVLRPACCGVHSFTPMGELATCFKTQARSRICPAKLIEVSFATLLLDWYKSAHRDLPWRKTSDPYAIWVSEIMLQQTRVTAVIPYYGRFLESFPDVTSLAAASEEQFLAAWAGLGYYSRVRNMHRAS